MKAFTLKFAGVKSIALKTVAVAFYLVQRDVEDKNQLQKAQYVIKLSLNYIS